MYAQAWKHDCYRHDNDSFMLFEFATLIYLQRVESSCVCVVEAREDNSLAIP